VHFTRGPEPHSTASPTEASPATPPDDADPETLDRAPALSAPTFGSPPSPVSVARVRFLLFRPQAAVRTPTPSNRTAKLRKLIGQSLASDGRPFRISTAFAEVPFTVMVEVSGTSLDNCTIYAEARGDGPGQLLKKSPS
jgi:hypothetical protein